MVHLHTHTQYSLLDGFGRIKDLVAKAARLGMPALAITDHGYMYGVLEFYRECKAKGIKPILGVELYTCPDVAERTPPASLSHITLLAKNNEGLANLYKLASYAATTGFYYKPRVDIKLLRKYSAGVICLSGCLSGELSRLILDDKYEEAVALAREYRDIYGDDYYVELQYHGIPEERRTLPQLIRLSRELDIPYVATNDCHYVEKEDAEAQGILMMVNMKKTLQDANAYRLPPHFYLKSEEEMEYVFHKAAPGAVARTDEIAAKCDVSITFGDYHLPAFPTPSEFENNEAYLRSLCNAGLERRYGPDAEKYRGQLEFELKTIHEMGFDDYMLIVSDFIRHAKQTGVPVGPGRGSAAGSLVAYTLGITELEPMSQGLKFERFLNPERVTMPDIDVDFEPEGRESVVEYVAHKYGEDHVCQIVTFGSMAAKSAVRDVAKVYGWSPKEAAALMSAVPAGPNVTLDGALQTNAAFRRRYEQDPNARRVIDVARRLEGLPRSTGVHAAGVILAPQAVTEYIPIARNPNGYLPVSQFSMADVESVGMLKVDFLGLRNLTVIKDAVDRINNGWEGDEALDIWKVPTDDSAVYAMLAAGETKGVFQLESAGISKVLMDLKPTCFEDIVAVVALYRPGPMDSIPKFIEGKRHPEKVTYAHPLLKPILETTYGQIVYQEQVMEIVRACAGYSYGRSDLVRRAMAKKKPEKLAAEKEVFLHGKLAEDGSVEVPGCERMGIPSDVALQLWAEMESFASYAFNKAHAAAYADLAYRTAYLRCYFPLEFQAAWLTSCIGDTTKLLGFLADCDKRGIKVNPPDVNASDVGFTEEGDAIRFGLLAVKDTGKATIRCIVAERKRGAFTNLLDLMERVPEACDKSTLEALIKSGALDCFEQNRAQMLAVLPTLLKRASKARKEMMKEQISLEETFFSGKDDGPVRELHLGGVDWPDIPDLPRRTKLEQEMESTGLYLSGHPMADYADIVAKKCTHKCVDINATMDSELDDPSEPDAAGVEANSYVVPAGTDVRIAGVITNIRQIVTKAKKEQMCALELEDQTGKVSVTVFPRAYAAYGSGIKNGAPVIFYGRIDDGDFGRKVIVNSAEFLSVTEDAAS